MILSRVSQSMQLRHNDRILCNIRAVIVLSVADQFIYLADGNTYTAVKTSRESQTKETARGMCRSTPESARARTCIPRSLNFSSLSSLPRFHFPNTHTHTHVSFLSLSPLSCSSDSELKATFRTRRCPFIFRAWTHKKTREGYVFRRAGVTLLATSSHDINWPSVIR